MEVGSAMVALGGDSGNTVPKDNITPAEIAVLRVIHGDDAVFDIQKTGDINRSNRQELTRLTEVYGQRQPNGNSTAPAVSALFPGAAARVFDTFEELELDDSLFKPVERSTPDRDPLDHDGDGKKGGSAPSAATGLAAMTVAELNKYAADRGIDLTGIRKKDEIIAKIEEAEAAGDQDEEQAEQDQEEDEDGVGEMNDGVGGAGVLS
jgi:hypothetical protein